MEPLLENNTFTENHNENFIYYSRYSTYFSALKSNDANMCQDIFNNAKNPDYLINGQFKYDVDDKEKEVGCMCYPLSLACVYGASDVVAWLLEAGTKPEIVREKDIGNLLHCIAHFPTLNKAYSADSDDFIILNLLDSALSTNVMNQLMEDDNEKHGLRPMEMAFRFGAYNLGRRMMDLGTVYLTEYTQRGLLRSCRYDLSVYDSESIHNISREDKSPIQFMRYIPSAFIENLTDSMFPEDPLIDKWMNQKKWRVRFYVFTILWLLFRNLSCPFFMYTAGEMIEIVDKMNKRTLFKKSHPNVTLDKNFLAAYSEDEIILLIYLCLALFLRISSLIERVDFHLRRKKYVSKLLPSGSYHKENLLITGIFYRLNRFTSDWLAISIYVQVIWAEALHTETESLKSLISFWLVLFAVTNLFYIEVLFPFNIAKQVILLRVTVTAFLTISFIFYYWIYFFAELFKIYLVEEWPVEFNNTLSSMYSTTKIFLNEFEFETGDDYNLMLVHFLFIMIVGMCLINTITALMSDNMVEISGHLSTYYKIQRLDLMMKINNICQVIGKLSRRCNKKTRFVSWVQKQDFVRFKKAYKLSSFL